jgi:hypothetical protein
MKVNGILVDVGTQFVLYLLRGDGMDDSALEDLSSAYLRGCLMYPVSNSP